jgi:hypothetical protein
MLAKPNYKVETSPKVTIPPFYFFKKCNLKFVGFSMGALIFGKYLHHATLVSNKNCSKHLQAKSWQSYENWLNNYFILNTNCFETNKNFVVIYMTCRFPNFPRTHCCKKVLGIKTTKGYM